MYLLHARVSLNQEVEAVLHQVLENILLSLQRYDTASQTLKFILLVTNESYQPIDVCGLLLIHLLDVPFGLRHTQRYGLDLDVLCHVASIQDSTESLHDDTEGFELH